MFHPVDNSFPRPSQLLPRARAGIATPSERVDSRLVRCKTFEGRTLFFPRRKKDASRPLTVGNTLVLYHLL